MHMLVKASQHLCVLAGCSNLDYGEVGTATLEHYGSPWFRKHAQLGSKLVNLFIIVTQFGFCCAYFVFIGANIYEVMVEYLDDDSTLHKMLIQDPHNSQRVIMSILVIPFCALSSIRNLDHLAPFSAVANLATGISVAFIFSYLIPHSQDTSEFPKVQSFKNFALFFGAACFSFEGISVVLPLENNIDKPEDFPFVLNIGMCFVTVLYITMGVLGYRTFGDSICGSVTLNLPEGGLYSATKILYSCVIFISFAVQFYVPITFLWPAFKDKFCPSTAHPVRNELFFRYLLVALTGGMAILIPDLGDIISLVGALASSMLALILPPLIDSIILRHNQPLRKWQYVLVLTKNAMICCFGVMGMVVGTIISMEQLITDLSPSKNTNSSCVQANSSSFDMYQHFNVWDHQFPESDYFL